MRAMFVLPPSATAPVTRRFAALLGVGALVVVAAMAQDARPGHAAATVASLPVRGAQQAIYHNPVFSPDYPDPAVLKVGGDYYAYGTTTGWETSDHLFPILYSHDLAHWRYVADAMPRSPDWGVGDWWAPDVIAQKGVYYMYYTGKDLNTGQHCVAVATASKPTGPFTHRRVIGCADQKGQGYIDPAPLIDADGKNYLYVSVDNPYHSISVIPLKSDLIHAAGPRKELFTLTQAWEHGPNFSTVEGPFIVKHGKTYDLFYSGNDWQHDYAMGYATSSSPLGPFKKCVCNPILHDVSGVIGPGGGSVIQGPHGGWWLVYHAWTGGPGYNVGGVRNLRIDPLMWKGDTISVRGPTTVSEPVP